MTIPMGEVEVRLIAQGGRIGLGETTENGEPVFVPLERVRTHRYIGEPDQPYVATETP